MGEARVGEARTSGGSSSMGAAAPASPRSSVSPSFTAGISMDRFSSPRDSRGVVVPRALHIFERG